MLPRCLSQKKLMGNAYEKQSNQAENILATIILMNEQGQAYKVQHCIPLLFFLSQKHTEKRLL